MKSISIGKLRGFQQCTSERGTFTCLALDHRQNLRKANPAFMDNAELSRFKLDVTATLADLSTAVLLDPEVSAAQAIAAGVLPGKSAFVVAVESTGYCGAPNARQSQILPGWNVEKAKRMGASMIKLLVYYHPDSPTAPDIEAFVRQVADECARYDLGIMLEPLSYPLDPAAKKLSSDEKRYVVTETARRLTPLGVDVLKAEFPLDVADPDETQWAATCAEITAASDTPWILLSAAVAFETYIRQVKVACKAGASGIAVGRAVWQEAIGLDGEARLAFLRTTGRERLSGLTALCVELGKPITAFYTAEAPFDWFKAY
ncbi:MAG: tagatose 1,6-diphosphate aldolase [Anaerolineales bacterium]|nr:tagatose 1,6-diphosphate aldolase [Anaerolineales bacterium]